MPHPSDSFSYLLFALNYVQRKGIIHFYTFGQEKDIKDIRNKILSYSKKIKIKKIIKCGNYAPYTYRLCFDLQII